MAKTSAASDMIDARIDELGDWRGDMLSRIRTLIHEAVPEVSEEWKWMGTPVFEKDGILCTGETYKQVVKLTFAKGASLKDPKKLFNSSLDGNVRRAIDIREGETIDEKALKDLLLAAVALNEAGKAKKQTKTKPANNKAASRAAMKSPASKAAATNPAKAKPASKAAIKTPASKTATAKPAKKQTSKKKR